MLSVIDKKFFKLCVGSNLGKGSDNDLVSKCPVCGDSRTKSHMKRLHLYEKNGVTNVNCFNGDCSVHNKTMYSFLRDFYPDRLPQYKRENFNTDMDNLKNSRTLGSLVNKTSQKDANNDLNSDKAPEAETVNWDDWDDSAILPPGSSEELVSPPVVTQDLSAYMMHLKDSDEGIQYLRNRGIGYKPDKRGKWYFGTQDLKIGNILYKVTDSIIIPLYYDNEMYGFYSRSIKDKNFITYMNDSNIGFKIWNWFNIDKTKPVYIFEGIFDAISSGHTNIIALLGAKLPDERLKELTNPVFCLDNDKTGLVNSLEYAKKGFNVYIQPELIKEKDFNELRLNQLKLDLPKLISDNLYTGISAEIRIKKKL